MSTCKNFRLLFDILVKAYIEYGEVHIRAQHKMHIRTYMMIYLLDGFTEWWVPSGYNDDFG